MAKKKYYSVAIGRNPGIYKNWSGIEGAEAQVTGFKGARFKGFSRLAEAQSWFESITNEKARLWFDPIDTSGISDTGQSSDHAYKKRSLDETAIEALKAGKVVIYTDGGCIGNPGQGGYGVVLLYSEHRKEFSGGYRLTTNNRMELMACIVGLRAMKKKCQIVLHSDSQYVINGITKGWAQRWKANHWMRNKEDRAENPDLWMQLLELCDQHEVEFVWVRGHAGSPENERCDRLSVTAARQENLPADEFYERSRTYYPSLFDLDPSS
jgi:ribonuclease HI